MLRFNLRLKIFLAFLGVICAVVSLGYLSSRNLSRMLHAEAMLREFNSQGLFLKRARSDLETILADVQRFDSHSSALDDDRFDSLLASVLRNLDDANHTGTDAEIRRDIQTLRTEIVAFGMAVRRSLPTGTNEAKSDWPRADARMWDRRIRVLEERLDDSFDARFLATSLATNRRLRWAYTWFLGGIVFAILLSTGFGFYLHSALLKPLTALRRAAEQVHAGDFSTVLDESGDDEFSMVNHAFGEMSRALERQFSQERRLRAELDGANHQLKKEKEDFARLIEISKAASASLDLVEVLKILTTEASELIPCFRCSIFQVGPDSGRATVLSSSLHMKGGPITINLERYPEIDKAARRREIVQVDDMASDPLMKDVADATLRAGVGATLTVPMLHKGSLQALISFVRSEPAVEAFSPWEKCLAETVASIGAICLETARLYESEQSSRTRLEALNVSLQGSLEELGRTRDRLVASEKMAAVGQMAASLAHSLRNPLAAIRAAAQAGLSQAEDGRDEETLRDTTKLVDRMTRHLNQILDFSRHGREVRAAVQPNQVVRSVLEILRGRAAERGVTLSEDFDKTVPCVEANPERFERAILAIVENAIDASPPGGTVRVRTVHDTPGDVRIEVEDRGEGIPIGAREKVFEPFYSTKTEGTGLGTTIARKVVESMAGTIELRDSPEAGTVVVMNVPASPQ
ncbi:MAG: ATP-binding protein [Acidobacteriota bacterium]